METMQISNQNKSVFACYLSLSDDAKLWYGRHRADGHNFVDNIFGGHKPNAYKLSKEEAESVCQKTGCQMVAL